MNGSGLKEALCEIYAPTSVDNMLNRYAYISAVRGYTLTQYVLAGKILLLYYSG